MESGGPHLEIDISSMVSMDDGGEQNNENQIDRNEDTADSNNNEIVVEPNEEVTNENHKGSLDIEKLLKVVDENKLIQGVMYQQSYQLLPEKSIKSMSEEKYYKNKLCTDVFKVKNLYYGLEEVNDIDKKDVDKDNYSKEKKNNDYVTDILECNKIINMIKEGVYKPKYFQKLYIGKKHSNYFLEYPRPTIPLNIKKKKGNKYKYSFIFDAFHYSYYDNYPPTRISTKWTEGLFNIKIYVNKEITYKNIVLDPSNLSTTIELEWCFDFKPTDLLLEKLKLNVLQKGYSDIFYKYLISVDSVTWYIHFGLTRDLINGNNKKSKSNTFKYRYHYSDDVNFYGIPVVEYNENMDNSFKWQKLSVDNDYRENCNNVDNSIYDVDDLENDDSDYVNSHSEGETSENQNQKIIENPNMAQFTFTKSACKQYGFVLKAVVKGEFPTNRFTDRNYIALFEGSSTNARTILNDKTKALFDFDCVLTSEIENYTKFNKLDDYYQKSKDFNIIISPDDKNKDKDKDKFLNDKKTSDFSIIFLNRKNDINEENSVEEITYLRNNSNIQKESINSELITNENSNDIKLYTHKKILILNSEYFSEMFNVSSSVLYSEVKSNELILKDIDYISFYQILIYCYKGYIPNKEMFNMYDWLSLLLLSSRFLFNSISNICENELKKYISEETVNEISRYSIICNAPHLSIYCNLAKKYFGLKNDENDDIDRSINLEINTQENKNAKNECLVSLEHISCHIINFCLTILSYPIFFIILNAILLFCLPTSIITKIFTYGYKIFEYLYYNWSDISNSLRKRCNIIIYIIIFILATVIGFIVFFIIIALNMIANGVISFIYIICQGILWPIIDTIKSFIIINRVINDYYNRRRNIEKMNEEYYLSNIHNNNNNNNNNKYNEKTNSSAQLFENEKSNEKLIYKFIFDDPLNKRGIIVRMHNTERCFLFRIVLHIWCGIIKNTTFCCCRWWRLLFYNESLHYSLICPGIESYLYRNFFEGYRFFWWCKKAIIDEPFLEDMK